MKAIDKQSLYLTGKISFSRCKIYGLTNHERKKWYFNKYDSFHQVDYKQMVAHTVGMLRKYKDYSIVHSKFIDLYGIINLHILNNLITSEEVLYYNRGVRDTPYRWSLTNRRRFFDSDHWILKSDYSLEFHKGIYNKDVTFISHDYKAGYTLSNDIYENDDIMQNKRAWTYLNRNKVDKIKVKRREIKKQPKLFIADNHVLTQKEFVDKCEREIITRGTPNLKHYEIIVSESDCKSSYHDRIKNIQTKYKVLDNRWHLIGLQGFSLVFNSTSDELYKHLKAQKHKDKKQGDKIRKKAEKARRDAIPMRKLDEEYLLAAEKEREIKRNDPYWHNYYNPNNTRARKLKYVRDNEWFEKYPSKGRSSRKKHAKSIWRRQNRLIDTEYC